MTLELVTHKRVSIREFLKPKKFTKPITEVTIGDLHANALKLLYLLSVHGIVKIHPVNYQRLVNIYFSEQDLNAEILNEFDSIIAGIKVIRHDILIRLIGDELSDRGKNDYFTLKIFQKLKQDGVPFEITLSNHAAVFINAYEHYKINKKLTPVIMTEQYTQSLKGLNTLIEEGHISVGNVMDMIDSSYKPSLKM